MYWIPLFEILEQRGIRPCLVNARHMKNVPGRRTDWHECQWLQFLHSVVLFGSEGRGSSFGALRWSDASIISQHNCPEWRGPSQHVTSGNLRSGESKTYSLHP